MAVTALAADGPADTPVNVPGIRLTLELSDGSRIIGTPSIDSLKMTTDYASLQIPLLLLRTVELDGTNNLVHASFQNGDLLSGQLAADGIELTTIFGHVDIPITEIRTIDASRTGVTAVDLPQGCVLRYTFDTDDGDHVTNVSGGGNNGAVRGATYTTAGKVGGAMSFNGDRVGIIIGNPASMQVQDFTITAWIKRGNVDKPSARDGEDAEIFGYGHGGYMLGMLTDGRLFLSKIDINNVSSRCQVQDDAFHHVAVTKRGDQVIFYLDGIADPPTEYNISFEFNTDAAVGTRADLMVHSFLGIIDEVAFFNRPLTPDEIKRIYDSQK